MKKLAVVSGGAFAALAVSGGIASAQPNVDTIVHSTCTYPQVMSALNAQSPAAAEQINSSPVATGFLQQLVAAPPDGRRTMIAQLQAYPQLASYTGLIDSVASSCNNY